MKFLGKIFLFYITCFLNCTVDSDHSESQNSNYIAMEFQNEKWITDSIYCAFSSFIKKGYDRKKRVLRGFVWNHIQASTME
jgi:hypothetical protein